ncbi:hypothetical protein E2986_12331 [Frieseomelitta varia]|uniref:Uncharacterized protein n=1 Tax=Frieseomelitta varia TaxID=561572 RepID=A0A833W3Z3_9HYME|nr:hypothetical protein E2986_12331 [Frieseomelitta varia]
MYKYCHAATANFDAYLQPQESDINNLEIINLLNRWEQVIVFGSLRMMLAPLVETIVLYDRFLFLSERNLTPTLKPVFDSRLSPRNLKCEVIHSLTVVESSPVSAIKNWRKSRDAIQSAVSVCDVLKIEMGGTTMRYGLASFNTVVNEYSAGILLKHVIYICFRITSMADTETNRDVKERLGGKRRIQKNTFEACLLYKNIHTYVASSTPFPLNIFANFTNSNKSFYIDILETLRKSGLPEYPLHINVVVDKYGVLHNVIWRVRNLICTGCTVVQSCLRCARYGELVELSRAEFNKSLRFECYHTVLELSSTEKSTIHSPDAFAWCVQISTQYESSRERSRVAWLNICVGSPVTDIGTNTVLYSIINNRYCTILCILYYTLQILYYTLLLITDTNTLATFELRNTLYTHSA